MPPLTSQTNTTTGNAPFGDPAHVPIIARGAERVDVNERKIINGGGADVVQLWPIKHKFAWDAYNVGNANHWLPTEISMQKDIEQWKTLIDKLSEIREGWVNLQNNKDFYNANKTDIDRINEIIRLRASHARQIVQRMEVKEWFTDEEKRYVDQDIELFNEQNAIADRLNKKLGG